MKQIIATTAAPGAIGPYSQAVLAGDFLYISGQISIVPAVGEIVATEVVGQTRQALENMGAILAEAGMGFEHVVKTTVLLQHISDFAAMNGEYAKFFTTDCPARAAFEVAALPKGALVEIEAVAYRG